MTWNYRKCLLKQHDAKVIQKTFRVEGCYLLQVPKCSDAPSQEKKPRQQGKPVKVVTSLFGKPKELGKKNRLTSVGRYKRAKQQVKEELMVLFDGKNLCNVL